MLNYMARGRYFIFAVFCVLMVGFTYGFVPETKGISIDTITRLEPWRVCVNTASKANLQEKLNPW